MGLAYIIAMRVRDIQIFGELKVIQLFVAACFLRKLVVDGAGAKIRLLRAGREASPNFVKIPNVWLFGSVATSMQNRGVWFCAANRRKLHGERWADGTEAREDGQGQGRSRGLD